MRHCLKVSLSKKLILSQFSQKEITIFLNEKKKQKTEKGKPYLQFVSPTLISKKKNVVDGLILGRKRKNL